MSSTNEPHGHITHEEYNALATLVQDLIAATREATNASADYVHNRPGATDEKCRTTDKVASEAFQDVLRALLNLRDGER
jgi:hypothetical protein